MRWQQPVLVLLPSDSGPALASVFLLPQQGSKKGSTEFSKVALTNERQALVLRVGYQTRGISPYLVSFGYSR
jgi:hypothetical protein